MRRSTEGQSEQVGENDTVFDISNKRRLGRSEPQLIQDLYDGLVTLIAKDDELRDSQARAAQEP